MASDFGDEAGEKLFDWMLRIGQEAGENAMTTSAKRLKDALRSAREKTQGTDRSGEDWAKLNMEEFKDLPEYETIKGVIAQKLNEAGVEHSFYENKAGESWLLFRVANAQDVSRIFEELEKQTDRVLDKAKASPEMERVRRERLEAPATEKQLAYLDKLAEKGTIPSDEYDQAKKEGLTVGSANSLLNKYADRYLNLGDEEPLEERADRAREGSKALAEKSAIDKEISRTEVHAK